MVGSPRKHSVRVRRARPGEAHEDFFALVVDEKTRLLGSKEDMRESAAATRRLIKKKAAKGFDFVW